MGADAASALVGAAARLIGEAESLLRRALEGGLDKHERAAAEEWLAKAADVFKVAP